MTTFSFTYTTEAPTGENGFYADHFEYELFDSGQLSPTFGSDGARFELIGHDIVDHPIQEAGGVADELEALGSASMFVSPIRLAQEIEGVLETSGGCPAQALHGVIREYAEASAQASMIIDNTAAASDGTLEAAVRDEMVDPCGDCYACDHAEDSGEGLLDGMTLDADEAWRFIQGCLLAGVDRTLTAFGKYSAAEAARQDVGDVVKAELGNVEAYFGDERQEGETVTVEIDAEGGCKATWRDVEGYTIDEILEQMGED